MGPGPHLHKPQGSADAGAHRGHMQRGLPLSGKPFLLHQPPGAPPPTAGGAALQAPQTEQYRLEVSSQPPGRADGDGMNIWQQTRGTEACSSSKGVMSKCERMCEPGSHANYRCCQPGSQKCASLSSSNTLHLTHTHTHIHSLTHTLPAEGPEAGGPAARSMSPFPHKLGPAEAGKNAGRIPCVRRTVLPARRAGLLPQPRSSPSSPSS